MVNIDAEIKEVDPEFKDEFKKESFSFKSVFTPSAFIKELFFLLPLTAIFIVLTLHFWGTQGDPLVDRGRELYFPQMMNQGAVLYRDLFNHQGPLSYQLNALLISVFSDSLNTYLSIAAGLCFSLLLTAYFMARNFFSRWASTAIALIVLIFCFFSINRSPTPMFPYSYSIMYALSFYMGALLCSLLWVRFRHGAFFLLAALLMGASAMSKIDFIGFIPLLIVIGLYYKKPITTKGGAVFSSLFSFVFIPLLSVAVLAFRGLTLPDFLLWFQDFQRYTSSYAQVFYASHGFFLTPLQDFSFLKTALFNGLIFFLILIPFTLAHYGVLKIFFSKALKKRSLYFALSFIGLLLLYGLAFIPALSFFAQDDALTFTPLFVLLSFLSLFGAYLIKKKPLKTLDLKEQCAFWLGFGVLAGIIRVAFYLDMGVYGNYFLLPILLAMALITLYFLPRHFKKLDSRLWAVSVLSFFLLMGSVRLLVLSQFIQNNRTALVTEKGTLYIKRQSAKTLQETHDYLKAHVPVASSLFMMPDGPLFNYIFGYKTDAYLFSWHPPHVDLLGGEEQMLQRFKAKEPDYVLLQNYTYDDYGVSDFKSYAPKMMGYIETTYEIERRFEGQIEEPIKEPIKNIEKPLVITLYRRKS